MTNAERFRAKTDEELAEFLSCFVTVLECPREVWDALQGDKSDKGYANAWLVWLRSESKKNPAERCKGCRWRRRHQKCSCCRRNPCLKDCYEEAR